MFGDIPESAAVAVAFVTSNEFDMAATNHEREHLCVRYADIRKNSVHILATPYQHCCEGLSGAENRVPVLFLAILRVLSYGKKKWKIYFPFFNINSILII